MALIICKECGKEYSDKSMECPICACPTDYNIKESNDGIENNEVNAKSLLNNLLKAKQRKKIIVFMAVVLILCVTGLLFKGSILEIFNVYGVTYVDAYVESSTTPAKSWEYKVLINGKTLEKGEHVFINVPDGGSLPIEVITTSNFSRSSATDSLKKNIGDNSYLVNHGAFDIHHFFEWSTYEANVVYVFNVD